MDAGKEANVRERFAAQRQDPDTVERDILDPVPYHYAGRHLDVAVVTEEFGHICPMTGLPDSGTLEIAYVPDQRIVELKSLKYYLLQYRQVGIFYEHVVHKILDDLVAAVAPVRMTVQYDVAARGGLRSRVTATYPEPAA